ncbi:hypothetical protein [Flexivirga sp. B27]
MTNPTRRQVARTAAWTVPVLAVAGAAPAASASTGNQACPGTFAGPVGSWLSSTGFDSFGAWNGGASWYLDINLTFASAGCGFGSDYGVETAAADVVTHYEQNGATGTKKPALVHTGLDSFSDSGVCSDKLILVMGGLGEPDLFVTKVNFLYTVSGLPGQGDTPCTVPVVATLTYPAGAEGNNSQGAVTIS